MLCVDKLLANSDAVKCQRLGAVVALLSCRLSCRVDLTRSTRPGIPPAMREETDRTMPGALC